MWALIFLGAFVTAAAILLWQQASDTDWDILVAVGLVVFLALWASGVLDHSKFFPGVP